MIDNFCEYIVKHNGFVNKLNLPTQYSEGLGVCNPSVYIDKNNKILCCIRRVNYLFHLSLTSYWNSAYGPTNYHHPDKDVNLRTENYLCELNADTLEVKQETIKHVEYQKYEPKWNFVGEEDSRIVCWDNKLYLTGCRRDTEDTGISRMELSEINSNAKEISRTRIPSVKDNSSYCEKNWMAILDKPFCYVKWCNPLEIVEYNPETKSTTTILLKNQNIISSDVLCDLRGSSQVITVDNYYIAIVHEVNLWYNRYSERSAKYYNRFIVWDKDWNVVKLSQRFWFMNFPIEFTNGLAFDGKDFIIPFSVYDNAAFVAKLNKNALYEFIGLEYKQSDTENFNFVKSELYSYIYNIYNPEKTYALGMEYYKEKQYSCAHAFFLKSAELSVEDENRYKKIGYDAFYMAQKCIEMCGDRQDKIIHQYNMLIQWDPDRYEAYYELSRQYYGAPVNLNDYLVALGYASVAVSKLNSAQKVTGIDIDEDYMTDRVKFQYGVCCYRCSKDYIAKPILKDLLNNGSDIIKKQIEDLGLVLD